jgi:glutamate racemase
LIIFSLKAVPSTRDGFLFTFTSKILLLQPIGIFDSGYGGLTVMKEIVKALPGYDYLYLGDNARAPYGTRSFDTVYKYTWQCVQWFFSMNCPLVILACNTASAKALRTIQQNDLPKYYPDKKVLGVIRPTAEVIGNFTESGSVGILATKGTVESGSYKLEIEKFYPGINVYQQACPIWVPLVENRETDGPGVDYFVKKYLNQLFEQSADIDTLLLACTHYPLLMNAIRKNLKNGVQVISQGGLVAESLVNYLQRHPEVENAAQSKEPGNFFQRIP